MDIIEVDNSIKSNKFLNETALQLEKDFLMIGFHFDIEHFIFTYKDIFSFTFHLIELLNNQEPKKTEMIVKRELQKVIIKNYYSNPENQ